MKALKQWLAQRRLAKDQSIRLKLIGYSYGKRRQAALLGRSRAARGRALAVPVEPVSRLDGFATSIPNAAEC